MNETKGRKCGTLRLTLEQSAGQPGYPREVHSIAYDLDETCDGHEELGQLLAQMAHHGIYYGNAGLSSVVDEFVKELANLLPDDWCKPYMALQKVIDKAFTDCTAEELTNRVELLLSAPE